MSATSLPPSDFELDDALYARALTWSDAQALAQQTVSFFTAEGERTIGIDMQVLSATQTSTDTPGMLQFSLVFRGPRKPQLPQRTYRVRHAQLGDYAIFITPIAQSAGHVDYEACFSHAV